MNDKLSIVNPDLEVDINTNREDIAALFVKGIFGIIPFGSPIGEAIASVIPNQKVDRLVEFVQILNYKLQSVERKIDGSELKTKKFTDLLEDALGQASRALSKDRLEYIASVLKNSLTDAEGENTAKKKLLSILDQLNDAEIIWLQYYSLYQDEKDSYLEKHKSVIEFPFASIESKPSEFDNQAIRNSYKENLIRLGLLREKFKRFDRNEPPEFDQETGRPKAQSVEATGLGDALLRNLDLLPSDSEVREASWK